MDWPPLQARADRDVDKPVGGLSTSGTPAVAGRQTPFVVNLTPFPPAFLAGNTALGSEWQSLLPKDKSWGWLV